MGNEKKWNNHFKAAIVEDKSQIVKSYNEELIQKFVRYRLSDVSKKLAIWEFREGNLKRPGEIFKRSYFENAIMYINRNREKHGLQKSRELEEIISRFTISGNVTDQPSSGS